MYLGHPYNITVGSGVVIGDYCSLHKGCTIGSENRGKRCGAPVLGDRVYVGINATIIGNIKIGNDVMIAPNRLVNFDVLIILLCWGIPARFIIKKMLQRGILHFAIELLL